MQTIAEEGEGERPALSIDATALPRAPPPVLPVRASTASGGFGGGAQLQRARLGAAQPRPGPDSADLNIAGESCAIKPPPPGILANAAEAILPAGSSIDLPVLPGSGASSRSPSRQAGAHGGPLRALGDREALKLIKRKRDRARKQKVLFNGLHDGDDTSFPPKGEAVYMPAYIPKSKSRAQLKNAQPGPDDKDPVATLPEAAVDGERFIELSGNRAFLATASEHATAELDQPDAEDDGLGLKENKTEIRQRVGFAIGQVRQTVLKHILLRNKLIDFGVQLNTLPKANLVALVVSSTAATRELLRGAYLQGPGGTHAALNGAGVVSLDKYKKFVELEPTPRPVSDTYNLSVMAGPGLFQRNRFPPGSTALERLTWWERQAENIFRDYEFAMSAKARGGGMPSIEGWVDDKEKYLVMFDDRHRMHKILEKDQSKAKMTSPIESTEAAKLALEAESELSQAISAAKHAQEKLSQLQHSRGPTRSRTSFSMASQRIDTALKTAGGRSSWPRTSGPHRSASRSGGHGAAEGINNCDEEAAFRPATDGGFARRRAASVDPAAMAGGEGIRKLTPLQRSGGRRSPLRYRVREEERERGSLSPSRFVSGGEFLPEYAHKNNFAGGRRNPSIRAGEPYQDQTIDHLNTLLTQKTPKGAGAGEQEEAGLPPHLLALKNLGTKRWRKAYERGLTDFVPDIALNPRDSRIFDLWGAHKHPAPPPVQTRLETPEHQKKGMMKQARGGYGLHFLGEPKVRDSTVYHFASVLHPKDHMVS